MIPGRLSCKLDKNPVVIRRFIMREELLRAGDSKERDIFWIFEWQIEFFGSDLEQEAQGTENKLENDFLRF